ncbi:unnamed protein product [Taenia asiatica]|uniref:Branchpoint-bridging protein n=1 Tax=Taenia asiatica TaxID=60517 RepID=A0A0R3VX74_TAEAS|nr:unnamed protein product [Taenia asiatica]
MSKRAYLCITDGSDSKINDPSAWAIVRPRKRRSRWSNANDDKTYVPGMPTQLPPNLTPAQEKMYILQLQIEDITRRLKTGDLGIPANPEDRSPSPEPVYSSDGKRLNTREYRTRKTMEENRHNFIQQMLELNPDYKPPIDYRAPQNKITDKIFIPQEDHPHINFVGLLIGPRGNTLKALEKEVLLQFPITGAKIIIRGKGSVKDGKLIRRDGMPIPGEDEPLHAFVSAATPESCQKAVEKIQSIIRQGIEVPEGENDLRKSQLRELALLNGTLREHEGLARLRAMAEAQNIATNKIQCSMCGGFGHLASDCKLRDPSVTMEHMGINPMERAKMDSEYTALMAELGVGYGGGAANLPPGVTPGMRSTRSGPPKQPPPPGVVPAPEEEGEDKGSGTPTSTTTSVLPPPPQVPSHPAAWGYMGVPNPNAAYPPAVPPAGPPGAYVAGHYPPPPPPPPPPGHRGYQGWYGPGPSGPWPHPGGPGMPPRHMGYGGDGSGADYWAQSAGYGYCPPPPPPPPPAPGL